MTLDEVFSLWVKWKNTEREFDKFCATCKDEEEVTSFALDVINDRDAFGRALQDWLTAARNEQ